MISGNVGNKRKETLLENFQLRSIKRKEEQREKIVGICRLLIHRHNRRFDSHILLP